MPPTIFISAGEASGEHYGALLAASIRQQFAAKGETVELVGMGGTRMTAAGVECVVRAEDMAVMGLTEVVLHLPRIYREFRKLKSAIRARRPAVAVLIDFPEIHFRLAKEFHRLFQERLPQRVQFATILQLRIVLYRIAELFDRVDGKRFVARANDVLRDGRVRSEVLISTVSVL